MYWVWGVSLFLYQSLDAIDGKQARRTGMAGPLGEMFDHGEAQNPVHSRTYIANEPAFIGCDAINTT
ncbi:hypothetical protein FRC15_003564, partial [Serendipita sp. 397]